MESCYLLGDSGEKVDCKELLPSHFSRLTDDDSVVLTIQLTLSFLNPTPLSLNLGTATFPFFFRVNDGTPPTQEKLVSLGNMSLPLHLQYTQRSPQLRQIANATILISNFLNVLKLQSLLASNTSVLVSIDGKEFQFLGYGDGERLSWVEKLLPREIIEFSTSALKLFS